MKQPCSRWGCNKTTTYNKPLCYEHWQEWEAWELDECNRCHFFYSDDDFILYEEGDYEKEYPLMCDNCFAVTLVENGKSNPWLALKPEIRPVATHATITRPRRYIYILKLSDATFYIGQTNDLIIRIEEHRDGQQSQTRDKDPKLVYYESYDGMRLRVNEREKELTLLNQTGTGRRQLRKMIEEFRIPLRLLDLEV